MNGADLANTDGRGSNHSLTTQTAQFYLKATTLCIDGGLVATAAQQPSALKAYIRTEEGQSADGREG